MLLPAELLYYILLSSSMLETLLAASLDDSICCLDSINVAGVVLMTLSSSLRKATQWKQPDLLVASGLGKALQPLYCSSATWALEDLAMLSQCNPLRALHLHPNDSSLFCLKVLSKVEKKISSKAGENIAGWREHTYFATASGTLGTFDPLCLSLSRWHAVEV